MKYKRIISYLLVLSFLLLPFGTVNSKAEEHKARVSTYQGEGYYITFQMNSSWEGAYNVTIEIKNTGVKKIENWKLLAPIKGTITDIWNAQVESKEDEFYIIKNAGWNQDIEVNTSISFGFAVAGNLEKFPDYYSLLGEEDEVEKEDYTISLNIDSDWGTGFTGNIAIVNNTNQSIEDWYLEFDFENEISNIWDAVIKKHEGKHYIVSNAGYNQNIAAGSSISFGFTVSNGKSDYNIQNTVLYNYDNTENLEIFLDTDDMKFCESEDGNFYFLDSKKEKLTGRIEGTRFVKKLSYSIKNQKEIEVCSGDIKPSNRWESDEIGFAPGYNLVTMRAETYSGTVTKEYIIINSNKDNISNAEIDTFTDSEGDGLPDYFEELYGLNPASKDTDGDGINDYIEFFMASLDPLKYDSNDDGIMDGEDDYDNDGISNLDEIEVHQTDLTVADTDGDGLSDGLEINTYKTEPKKEDTDGDGLSDWWEIKVGSDPLVPETNFTRTISAESYEGQLTRPEISVTGITADQVSTLNINPVTSGELANEEIPGYIDGAYEFHINGEFRSAEVAYEFDKSLINKDFIPALYFYNEETQLLEYVEGQKIEGNKVIAKLNHFSKYILLNKKEQDNVRSYTFLYKEDAEGYSGLDVAFVIDSSGSMAWNDSDYIRIQVAKNFVGRLTDNDNAAVIDFDDKAIVLSDFTSDKSVLNSGIDKINANGGTDLSAGIESAISLFNKRPDDENRLKYIIMLTDGSGSYSTAYTTKASEAGIAIYTVGLGSNILTSVLTAMAEGTGGSYYHASKAEELYAIFEAIADKSDLYKDTDKDGINDYYEKEMMAGHLVLGTGAPLRAVNYLNPDSDGDTLLDGEELEIKKFGEFLYVYLHSNPAVKDTDGDGMDDNADPRPLVPDVSEVLIHQTRDGEGLKKKTDFKDNIVADDLTFNDYSYTEIIKATKGIGVVAWVTPEFMMWSELADLFLIGCVTSDFDMSVTLMDMLHTFEKGNVSNIGEVVNAGEQYDGTKYIKYSDSTLTERVRKNKSTQNYLDIIKKFVEQTLGNNNGDLSELEYVYGTENNKVFKYVSSNFENSPYPQFTLSSDISLVLAIHAFQGHNITVKDYKCDGKTFSGKLAFHFYDHFGLDETDYTWAPGFCDWFTLQHYDRFNGSHSPFITSVDLEVDFSGNIQASNQNN